MSRKRRRSDLYGSDYQRFRRSILERDNYRCTACGKAGLLEVHHIRPVHKGGALRDPNNVTALCRGCHIRITKAEGRARTPRPLRDAWWELIEELW